MSRVSLSGNPSGTGTFTIASPNSNTDRTLSLPDQTGTLLTGSGALNINASAPASSLTLDASGQLGVGITSPASRLHVNDTASANAGVAATIIRQNGGINNNGLLVDVTNTVGNYVQDWRIANSSVARIDPSGNLLVGTTSTSVPGNGFALIQSGSGSYGVIGHASGTASGTFYLGFTLNGSAIGSIQQSGTTNVLYSTSSDYRLKEDIQPMVGALAKVSALKPVTYKWKSDGSDGQGFIAHELQAVVPDCVTGEKDAVDADGKPVYQGIDTSFLVATLTAAIQELKADLDATKAELAALKGQQ
jgi:hypothetical protein